MKIGTLKNVSVACTFRTFLGGNNGYWNSDYTMSDSNVLISGYNVGSAGSPFMMVVLTTNSTSNGVITDNVLGNRDWSYGQFTNSDDILYALGLHGIGFNETKCGNTLNALQNRYGNIYLRIYQFNPNPTYEGCDVSLSVSGSSYYLSCGQQYEGTYPNIPIDLGKGDKYGSVEDIYSSLGALLAMADGDLEANIVEPNNPLTPGPSEDGNLVFRLGSAGTGNGYNTYKLTWSVEQDSESVNYSEMDFTIGFYQDSLETKGGNFKKQKVGKSGSVDFSYANAVSVAGWSWIDKLKDKLPIVDPSPTMMSLNFYVNDVKLFNQGLPCLLYYDGSVKLILIEQVRDSITFTDDFGNKYTIIAGNAHGENNKNDMDDDDKDKDDDEKGDGDDKKYTGGTDSVNGSALLTTSYSLTVSEAHSFGSWLWSSTMIDNIHLVNNNPIENIVACKLFPFSVGGTESSIQLGNVTSNVTGQKLAENVARTFVMNGGNAIRIPRYYSSPSVYGGKYAYLDNAPFTSCRIYLPYLGIKELDASEVLGKDLYIKYYVDLVTGMCRAVIQTDKRSLYVFDGQIGQDVPITASNRAQVEVGYITGGLQSATQIAMGAMTGNVFGVISGINGAINTATNQYHSETHGTPTPCNSRFDSQIAYIIVDRPDLPNIPSKFAHQNGRICNKTLTISNLSGYTELDNTVDLSGIQCTDTERSELLTILSSGFYA